MRAVPTRTGALLIITACLALAPAAFARAPAAFARAPAALAASPPSGTPQPTGGGAPLPPAAAPGPGPAGRALRRLRGELGAGMYAAGRMSSALVVDLTTGATLYAAAADAPRLPASVEKLFTTSTALLTYGPSATLDTTVLGAGELGSDGTWHGALFLRGGGDPTFGAATFDRAAYGTGATVEQLAARLAAAGIRRVDGPIIGDGTFLDPLRGTPATAFRPSTEVEGELSGLSFDAGFTSPTEVALQPRPVLYATRAFVAALKTAGIRIPAATPIFTGATARSARVLATVSSPPMAALIQLTNAPSDNYFAETLLKDIGARYGAGGSTAAGAGVVAATMRQTFHIDPRLNDGSGLSRFDRTTAAQIVSLLSQQDGDQPFVNSLAIAGVRGTMQHEMLGTPAVNDCRGKTGTLRDVANLAGYCTARNGDLLVFAFLFNGLGNADAGHLIEDRMGAALAEYNP